MEGLAGIGAALAAMAISFVLLAYPAYFASKALQLPWIYDITTDPIDPPRYEALARLRPRDANPVAYAGLYAAEQQRLAYPDVAPLAQCDAAGRLRRRRLAAINKRRWRVVDARSPQAGRREGRIEAVARTPIMGFRDDVVVRVRAEPDGARIDARSSSRYGTFDFGANAARIRTLMNDIEEAMRTQRPERTPAPPPGKKSAPAKKDRRISPNGSGPRSRRWPSVDARPRATRSSRWASTDSPAAFVQPRIEADIDCAHERGNIGLALAEPVQDRSLARLRWRI